MALRDAISTETDGNPFFATEIVRHLTESGATSRNGRSFVAVDVGEAGLPVSVRQVVGDRWPVGLTATALRTAAVIGRDFDLDLLPRWPTSTRTRPSTCSTQRRRRS